MNSNDTRTKIDPVFYWVLGISLSLLLLASLLQRALKRLQPLPRPLSPIGLAGII